MMPNNISPVAGPDRVFPRAQTSPPERLLVVDDDECIRRLNATALLRSGYEVDMAADGADAWDALQSCGYDLIITDHIMPKLTGLELIKKMQAARLALPVIMASGSLPLDEFDRAPWLKPAALLVKPYMMNTLVQTVKSVLRATVAIDEPVAPPPSDPGERPSSQSGGKGFLLPTVGPWPFLQAEAPKQD